MSFPGFFYHLKQQNMRTIIDIRIFAIEQAVKIMGTGTPCKDVVDKAKEIEAYIAKDLTLPADTDNSILSDMMGLLGHVISDNAPEEKKVSDAVVKEESRKKEK